MITPSEMYLMERKVISFLKDVSKDEIHLYLEQINDDDWHPNNQKLLALIRDYASQEFKEENCSNWLMNYVSINDDLIDVLSEFIPSPMGKKYLQDITYQKEEQKFKKALKQLETRPLEDIKPALQELLKTPVSAYKPKSLMQTAKQRIVEMQLERDCPSTGYKHLDRYIKGFIPGHVYVLSGNTNAGKSAICLNWTHRVSRQDKKVLYFALEPENTIVNYLASIRCNKRFEDLSDDDLKDDDENIHVFGKDNIYCIEDLVKAIYTLPRYDLIIIDHIGYFTGDGQNTFHKQSDVMKQLAGLAKDRQSAIVVVQHLNKAKNDKNSPENNITGSASFKQDATEVLILIRDTEEDEYGALKALQTGALQIRKTKTGNPQGSVRLTFLEGTSIILDDNDKQMRF